MPAHSLGRWPAARRKPASGSVVEQGATRVRGPLLRNMDAQAVRAYTAKVVEFARAARTISRNCTCLRVRQASRVLTRVYDEVLRPLGVQTSQLTLLVAVAEFGESGASLGALADALVMDRTTLTRNVRPLENAGLLRNARSPED